MSESWLGEEERRRENLRKVPVEGWTESAFFWGAGGTDTLRTGGFSLRRREEDAGGGKALERAVAERGGGAENEKDGAAAEEVTACCRRRLQDWAEQ